MVRETLMSIPPDEFLKIHSRLTPPSRMNRQEGVQFYTESKLLFGFGRYLQFRTRRAGRDRQFPIAIRLGSDRLFLSLLKWLQPENPSAAQIETGNWLKTTPLRPMIEGELYGLTEENDDTDTVTERGEAEIADYPAFVALGSEIEPTLFERGVDIKVGAMERLGIALAGLALKRQLAKSEVDALEALFALEELPDSRRID